jgi:hypothetical protein
MLYSGITVSARYLNSGCDSSEKYVTVHYSWLIEGRMFRKTTFWYITDYKTVFSAKTPCAGLIGEHSCDGNNHTNPNPAFG